MCLKLLVVENSGGYEDQTNRRKKPQQEVDAHHSVIRGYGCKVDVQNVLTCQIGGLTKDMFGGHL